MSSPYTGNYSFNISALEANSAKRYLMAVQRGKPVLDSELSEIAFSAFTGLRNYLRANIGDGAMDESFKIIESSTSTTNNFTITGGTGSIEHPAMMFVKGIPVLALGNFDYNTQNAAHALSADNYTKTLIPGLTTPGANRTDIVYMDVYFAEVSSELDTEYQDASLKNGDLNVQSANRFRLVQDIRVAEGGVLPTDNTDINGIYHRYIKLATINRLAGNNAITNAMIVDERFVTISIKKLTDGTGVLTIATLNSDTVNTDTLNVGDINMSGDLLPNADGSSNLGDPTHRFANLYMSSNIDTSGGLVINHSGGSTGQALKITRSLAGTGNLFNIADFVTVSSVGDMTTSALFTSNNVTDSTTPSTGAMRLLGGLGVAKNLNIGGNTVLTGTLMPSGGLIGPITSSGPLHITDTTQSTSASTGALIVDGGIGAAKDIRAGADVYIAGILRVPTVSGNVIFTGDVTIQGTTTTVSATNLEVTDKNITVNKGGGSGSEEGAGLTVERVGTDGSLIYRNSAQGKFAIGDIGAEVDVVIATRTISVSGNGLSGGGDFFSDRTITSNATAANTPSTIVFRDSSGNFATNSVDASTLAARDMTPGSVVFIGSAGGLLTEDNGNLFWNDSSNTLCIGTNSPDTANIGLSVKRDDGVANGEHFISEFYRDSGSAALSIGYRANGSSVTGALIRSGNSQPIFFGTTSNNTALKLTNAGDLIFSSKISSTESYLDAMFTLEASGSDYIRLQDGANVRVRMTPTMNYFVNNVMIGTSAQASSTLQLAGNTATLTFGAETTEAGPYGIMVAGSGGATPATKGTGNGRDLTIRAGDSDNTNSKVGGDLYIRGGNTNSPLAPIIPGSYTGNVRIADNGGNVIIGTNSFTDMQLEVATGIMSVKNHSRSSAIIIDSQAGQRSSLVLMNVGDGADQWILFKDDSGTDTFNIARSNTTLFSMSSNVTTFSNDLTVSKSSDVYVTASTSSGRVGLVLSPSLGNDAYIYMASKWLAGYDASAGKYKISYNDFGSVDAITIDDTTGLVTIANLSTGSLSGTDLDVNNLTVNGQGFFRGTSSSIDGVSADVGALIVGAIGGGQIQIDYDDIQAVNSGAATTLYLNYYGGDVSIASNGGTASFGGAMNVNGSVNFSGTLGVSGLITASGGLSLPSGDFTVGSGFAVRAPTGRFDNLNKYLTSQILVSDVMRMSGSTQLQFQDTGSIISTTGGGEFHIRSDRTTKLYTTNTNSLVLGVSNGTQLTLTNTTLVYSGFSNVFSVSGTSNLSTLNVSGVATINNILNVNGNTEFAIPVTINQSFSTSTTKTVYGLNVDFNGNQDSGAGGGDTLAGLGIRSYVHGTNTNSANNVVQNVAFFAEVTGGLRGALAAGTPANVAFYANINGNSSSDSYALYAPGQGHIYLGQGNISIASGNLTVGGTGEGIVTCNGINTNDVGSTNRFAYAQTTSTGSGTIAFSTLGVNSFAVRAVIVYVSTGADNWTLDNSVSFNAVSGNITGLAANTVHKVVVIHNS